MPRKDADTQKPTRASLISDALKEAILNGELAPGAKINLEDMRETYSVSLSPMREAVSRLVATGLVEFEDQRGYNVTMASLTELSEVTTLLASLSTQALEQAMKTPDLDWESAVLGAAHRLRRSAELGHENWDRTYLDFLDTMVRGCQMTLLGGFWDKLSILNDRYRRMARRKGHSPSKSTADACAAIANAVIARDTDLTCALLRQQIETAGERFADALEEVLG